MVLHLLIKNFGKVETADISFNNLVVFVGDNNSGKTMVMQLIYGIREVLGKLDIPASGAQISDSHGQYLIRCDQRWFRETELQINAYLAEHQAQIVEEIFGTPVPAGEIKIALEDTGTTFVSSISSYQYGSTGAQKNGISIDTIQYEQGETVHSFETHISDWDTSGDLQTEVVKIVWKILLSGKANPDSRQLFLPASRSGLQLLYKHYFAGESEGNLVMPVKEFLRFLQLYSENRKPDEARRALLEFGEERLLHGKVIQEGDETFYVEHSMGRPVSLYLASSMIHELAPFVKALSATRRIDWLYCDEVENSLHPLLQREMARWLVRMANAGMHIMISSHSDTMASRLNNLFMLTRLYRTKADYELLSELGLQDADLLRPDVHADVYEFRNKGQGKTVAEKLTFISHPMMGYDFQLFGENLDKLYEEADKITR